MFSFSIILSASAMSLAKFITEYKYANITLWDEVKKISDDIILPYSFFSAKNEYL